MVKVVKQSWISRMILVVLVLIVVEIPPTAVNFTLRYSKTSQLIVDGFMVLLICLMLVVIWRAHWVYEIYNQLGQPVGIKIGWIIGGCLAIALRMDVLSYLN